MSSYAIAGELTVRTAAEQKDSLLAALETGQALAISLTGVGEIDAAGLQLLLAVKREAADRLEPVRFEHPSAVVQRVLTLCRLDAQLSHAAGDGHSPKEA